MEARKDPCPRCAQPSTAYHCECDNGCTWIKCRNCKIIWDLKTKRGYDDKGAVVLKADS